jgi:glycosyltransferase involved in cell wall biosynthesis
MALKILQVHNRYTARGGEDTVLNQEQIFLANLGHSLETYIVDNDAIGEFSFKNKAKLALGIVEDQLMQHLKNKVTHFAPDIVIIYNTFPRLRFDFVNWLTARNIRVIKTISNYRAGCLNAEFSRNDSICQLCPQTGSLLPGLTLKCYHDSYLHSFGAYRFSSEFQTFLKTVNPRTTRLTYLNQIQREMLLKLGAPDESLFFKPNFVVTDPGPGEHKGNFGLFVGRLSSAKGIGDLLSAATSINGTIKIVGSAVGGGHQSSTSKAEFLGELPHNEIINLMKDAKFLVFPSKWYEGMPMVLLEALSTGLPIIASDLPTLQEIAPHDIVGWTYPHKDPVEGLKLALKNAFQETSDKLTLFKENARKIFLDNYSDKAQRAFMTSLYMELGLKL